jgi:hypothetical protein
MDSDQLEQVKERHTPKPPKKGIIWCRSCWFKEYPCDITRLLIHFEESE